MLLCLFLLLALSACAGPSAYTNEKTGQEFTVEPVSFHDLPAWDDDHQAEALFALDRSCTQKKHQPPSLKLGLAGYVRDWLPACQALKTLLLSKNTMSAADDSLARSYFETWFKPYAVQDAGGSSLFTGYYEPLLEGSKQRTRAYSTPLYARPDDLFEADLGDFKLEWHGQKIVGKIVGHKFVPYDDRTAIEDGSLKHRAKILVWVSDPVDAFFLAVQGSGRVHLRNGRIIQVGFDGTNGQPYTALGKCLLMRGNLESPVSMQKIREWLNANPIEAMNAMNFNPSYVFYKVLQGDGPLGAEGVALTPRRSLAVDPSVIPLGTPVWLSTHDGFGANLNRLLMAQDTGGAIKGVVRGDVFWGSGLDAEEEAGHMQSHGQYYVLLPKSNPETP